MLNTTSLLKVSLEQADSNFRAQADSNFRATHLVAATNLGKFPAALNNITKSLSVYVYTKVMLSTACTTFSLQGSMPFPLPTENNTRNEAASPECK